MKNCPVCNSTNYIEIKEPYVVEGKQVKYICKKCGYRNLVKIKI